MTDITIRQAVLADLDTLAPLFDQYRQFYKKASDPAGARAFLLERFQHGESVLFIAHDQQHALGFVQMYPAFESIAMRRKFIFNDFFVVKQGRMRGIGKGLIEACADFARGVGAGSLGLSTARDKRDEAKRMLRLIEDLISLSRIEAEKYRVPDTPIDLAGLVDDVRAELTDGAGNRGRDLVATIDLGVPPVSGDRVQLSQMLHNLVGNAMKYGRAGTPVTITLASDEGGMVRLSVRDEGDGIAAVHIPRLTERFYRADAGRSRSLGGTGLGLAIVKHIVERHRGRLDIASQVGVGTTVAVTLPPAGRAVSGNSGRVIKR